MSHTVCACLSFWKSHFTHTTHFTRKRTIVKAASPKLCTTRLYTKLSRKMAQQDYCDNDIRWIRSTHGKTKQNLQLTATESFLERQSNYWKHTSLLTSGSVSHIGKIRGASRIYVIRFRHVGGQLISNGSSSSPSIWGIS